MVLKHNVYPYTSKDSYMFRLLKIAFIRLCVREGKQARFIEHIGNELS